MCGVAKYESNHEKTKHNFYPPYRGDLQNSKSYYSYTPVKRGNEKGTEKMGDSHHLQNHQHKAMDGLVNLFTKANHDLNVVQHRLEKEFQQIYPENANPMKLVSRIKKIQDDVSSLKEQCGELLAAKQDLIDKARTTLVGNRISLQRLQASTGVPITSDSDDPAYSNFNQIIDEWTVQVSSKTGDEEPGSGSDGINQKLFLAIVQGN